MSTPTFVAAFQPLWAKLNPLHPGLGTPEKSIRGLTIFLAALSLYHVLTGFSLVVTCLQQIARSPLECLGYLAFFLLLPTAALAFGQRKPLGWTLAVGYLTLSLLGAGFGLWAALTWRPSGVAALDTLYPSRSPLPSVAAAAVFTGALVALGQPTLRQAFRISKRHGVKVVTVTVLLACAVAVVR
jgi:hypothetical protein